MKESSLIKPLDLCKTPDGHIVMVTDVVFYDDFTQYSVEYVDETLTYKERGKNAWWNSSELSKISSIPLLLAKSVRTKLCNSEPAVNLYFGL